MASRPGSSVVRSPGSSSDSGFRTTTTGTAGVVVGQAQRVQRRRPDERVGRRLDVARLGQRAADAAPAALHLGEAAAGRRRREHRRDVVVPGEPDDLLDQVGRVGQVGAPRRRRDGEGIAARVDVAADRARAARRPGPRCRARRRPGRDGRRRAAMDRPRGAGVDVDHPADDRRAAVLGEQMGGPGQGDHGHLRVDAALEALGRLAGQPVPARGARDAGRLPVRRLQQHGGGAVTDLGRGPAHDGGHADRPGLVGDQQVVGRELPRRCRRGWSAARPRGPAGR